MDEEMLLEWIGGKSLKEIAKRRGISEEEVADRLRDSLRALDDRLASGDYAGSD